MRAVIALLAVALALNLYFLSKHSGRESAAIVLQKIPNFRLIDQEDRSHELYRYSDAKAVVIISQMNGCTLLRQSFPAIKDLAQNYLKRDVAFLMINANPQDSREEIGTEAKRYELAIPILRDPSQVISRSLGIERSGEAIVIDTTKWNAVYHGAIDDRFGYGTRKPEAIRNYLADALNDFLAGRLIRTPHAEVKGCLIPFITPRKGVTYSKDVAPIFKAKCLACHNGSIDSTWAMSGYDRIKGWAPMIRESLLTGRMPPWHADPAYGKFKGDIGLTPAELRTVAAWIDAGAGRQDGPDPFSGLVNPTRREWRLGPPDLVVSMEKPQEIPASSAYSWRLVPMKKNYSADLWLRAVEYRPGNLSVVHHTGLFLPESPLSTYDQDSKHFVFIDGTKVVRDRTLFVPDFWTSGWEPEELPLGYATLIPKDTFPVLEMHYSPSGKNETDDTKVGFYFYHGPMPPKRVRDFAVETLAIDIPPFAKDSQIRAERITPKNFQVFGLRPHMHFRGSRMKVSARYPGGRTEVLLSVPNYDFNWQRVYKFIRPKFIPAGTTIIAEGAFDNSAQNPSNPDPSKRVRFGVSTTDEMFFLQMITADAD